MEVLMENKSKKSSNKQLLLAIIGILILISVIICVIVCSLDYTKKNKKEDVAQATIMMNYTSSSNSIVIDSSSEVNSHYSYLHSRNLLTQQFSQLEYLYFPLLDLQPLTNRQFEPILQLMQCIAQAIGKAKMPYTHISLNFHCVMGWSRSVALMICYLVHCQQLSPRRTDIFNWLNRYYPDAHVRAEYLSLTLLELLHEHGKTVNGIQDGFELIQKNRSAGKR